MALQRKYTQWKKHLQRWFRNKVSTAEHHVRQIEGEIAIKRRELLPDTEDFTRRWDESSWSKPNEYDISQFSPEVSKKLQELGYLVVEQARYRDRLYLLQRAQEGESEPLKELYTEFERELEDYEVDLVSVVGEAINAR